MTLEEAITTIRGLDFQALRWDGLDLEIVTPHGEDMASREFKLGSRTRNFIDLLEEECIDKRIPPFTLELMDKD